MEKWYKLQDLRKKQNLTQERLAKKLGISTNSIKNYERDINGRIPDYKALEQYHKFFNVSYDYLLDDNVENKTAENIQIEKILKLSDKAISNLKDYNHSGINLLLETKNFEEINNLIDSYVKLSKLLKMLYKIPNYEDDKTNLFIASKISEIINTYNKYKEENKLIPFYTKTIELINGIYQNIVDDPSTEDNNSNSDIDIDLMEEYDEICTIFENAIKMAKLELTEVFSKFLTTITD